MNMFMTVFASHASSKKAKKNSANSSTNGGPKPPRNNGARGVVGSFVQRFRSAVSSVRNRNRGNRQPGQ